MCHTMILWLAHCDIWSAQSSRFSIAAHASSELSEHASQHVSQSVSFLYIVVLCQFWLVKLSRFQYYFDCDCMFDLFYSIEVYICKVSLFSFQHTEVYSSEALFLSTLSEASFMICIIVFIVLWSQRLSYYFYYVVC